MIIAIAVFLGTAFFAASGVLASARRQMDWIGAVVLAIVTSVGGGTLRDILSGQLPVFWIPDPRYLLISIGTALLLLPFLDKISFPDRKLLLPDALGLAFFTWIGCEKVFLLGDSWIVVVILGVMTGTAGGLIRDVLSAQVPFILLKGELYAAASIPGALVFVVLRFHGYTADVAGIACFLTVLLLRLAAIRWKIMLPDSGGSSVE
jgi:uncharacterized membrane protein YeiH